MLGSIARPVSAVLGLLALSSFLLIPCRASAHEETEFSPTADEGLTRICDGVYAHVDSSDGSARNSFGANTGVIVTEGGIIVVDSLGSFKEAKHFIREIKGISDKPIRYMVNTHYHVDHAFGDSAFARLGATVVAHENCKKDLEERGELVFENLALYGLTDEDMEGTELYFPDLVFRDHMTIQLGGRKVELIYPGHTHSDDSIMVYLPDEKVLFAGDILCTHYHTYIAEGDLDNWLRTLDEIESMNVEKIIPAHGPVAGKQDIGKMKEYIVLFDEKARELCGTECDPDAAAEAMAKLFPPELHGKWLIKANLIMKYQQGK